MEDLARFRTNRLKKYMSSLIKEYKTPEEVAAHVQHPELTHTLISLKIRKDEKFEHMDAIKEAVKRYMEEDNGKMSESQAFGEDAEIEGLQSFEELEEYIIYMNNRKEEEAEEEQDDMASLSEESALIHDKPKREYAVYAMSDVIVDLSDYKLGDERAESINQNIAKISGRSKPYRVCYFINNRLVPSALYVDYIPEEINAIIRECA